MQIDQQTLSLGFNLGFFISDCSRLCHIVRMNDFDFKNLSPVQLKSKSLLYALDLKLSPKLRDTSLQIEATGHVRIGPKKSAIKGYSEYQVGGDKSLLKEFSLNVEGFEICEKYLLAADGQSYVCNGGSDFTVDTTSAKNVFGPLLPLLVLQKMAIELTAKYEVKILVGKKLRAIQICPTEKNCLVFNLDEKKRASFDPKNKIIKLFPFGIKIFVTST